MCEGCGSRSVYVTTLATTYPFCTFKTRCHQAVLWQFQYMNCVDFLESALLKSSGGPPLPSSLLDELLVNERDSDCFISRRLVCRSSDTCTSYNLTDSSLVTVGYQLPVFIRIKATPQLVAALKQQPYACINTIKWVWPRSQAVNNCQFKAKTWQKTSLAWFQNQS